MPPVLQNRGSQVRALPLLPAKMLKLLELFVRECSVNPALLPLCYHSPQFHRILKRLVGLVGGVFLHPWHHMAVEVQGDPDFAMPQPF
jgi:hypothetical protein